MDSTSSFGPGALQLIAAKQSDTHKKDFETFNVALLKMGLNSYCVAVCLEEADARLRDRRVLDPCLFSRVDTLAHEEVTLKVEVAMVFHRVHRDHEFGHR